MKKPLLKNVRCYVKMITVGNQLLKVKMSKIQVMDWIKQPHWTYKFIIFLLVSVIILPFWFDSAVQYFDINTKNNTSPFKWEVIKGFGYAIAMLLLIRQISISNRRADASEKTAAAVLSSSVEQRYHNAISHLVDDNPVIRIGAIYNLYHISQSTDTYDETIFDMFCEYLKRVENKMTSKEKQIIIDKLFRVAKKDRVLEKPENIDLTNTNLADINLIGADLTHAELTDVDLTGVDLTDVDLTHAELTGTKLTDAKLDNCTFDNANLTKAKLPTNLENIGSMNNATIDRVNFYTGSKLKGLILQNGSWKNAKVRYTNLSNAILSGTELNDTDFTGTDFTDAKGLTFEQLTKVKCLYNVIGLNSELENKLKKEKPTLFEKIKQE